MLGGLMDHAPNTPGSLYDPPTERREWSLKTTYTFSDLLKFLADELQINAASMQSIVHHGGLYLGVGRVEAAKPPLKVEAKTQVQVYRFLREPEEMIIPKEAILFEDTSMMAVNKPAWIPVQGTRVSHQFSLEANLRRQTKIPLMAVHRLDRQTSGVILFAKNSKSCAQLMKIFSERQVEKKYLAVVNPADVPDAWEVEGYMMRDFKKLPQVYFRMIKGQNSKARHSHSIFKCLDRNDKTALVEAQPLTGRTHQLRVHLASSGHPVVGDTSYGSYRVKKELGAQRILLHADTLIFKLKDNMTPLVIKAPLPADFLWKKTC